MRSNRVQDHVKRIRIGQVTTKTIIHLRSHRHLQGRSTWDIVLFLSYLTHFSSVLTVFGLVLIGLSNCILGAYRRFAYAAWFWMFDPIPKGCSICGPLEKIGGPYRPLFIRGPFKGPYTVIIVVLRQHAPPLNNVRNADPWTTWLTHMNYYDSKKDIYRDWCCFITACSAFKQHSKCGP